MMKAEIAKHGRKPSRIAIAATALAAVALIVGSVFGVNAASAYRADIEVMQSNAEDYYDAAAEQQVLAQQAADQAQEYADAASTSVTSLEAAEAARAAQAEADAAAAAAAQAAKSAQPSGSVKCPAGSSANSGDGPNDTSCFPNICFHLTLPDPEYPECEVAFKP